MYILILLIFGGARGRSLGGGAASVGGGAQAPPAPPLATGLLPTPPIAATGGHALITSIRLAHKVIES